jgi:hypothetical protein
MSTKKYMSSPKKGGLIIWTDQAKKNHNVIVMEEDQSLLIW